MFNFLKRLLGLPTIDVEATLAQGASILDVRTSTEYRRWHINSSVNIPELEVGKKIKEIRKLSSPVITCCRNGRRSEIAARILRGLGVEAYNGGSCRKLGKIVNKQKS